MATTSFQPEKRRALRRMSRIMFCGLLGVLLAPGGASLRGDDEALTLFEQSIAPVLEQRCLSCHRGDAARGGLSLETRAGALAGGDSGAALVPGDSASSLLVMMIAGDEPEMPKEGDALAAAEVAAIERWIDAGAPWPARITLVDRAAPREPWWSLVPLTLPAPPPETNSPWPRTPIDKFVLAELERKGLAPSSEASRATLLRRLTFDLHGLPPTPTELADFLNDSSPDAYERVVERLLASPRYGERWARHWLDVVHYGDTHGYDKDKRRDHAWRYRDWVIEAFNRDMPYAEFVTRQLAGDTLYRDDTTALIATGFVVAGPWDFVGHVELRDGTVEKEKTLALDRDDMVATTMSTFCSVTAHCARCHDHPFDPIPQRDHYRLQAVFAGVERADMPCPGPESRREFVAAMDAHGRVKKEIAELSQRADALETPELQALRAALQQPPAIEGWPGEGNPVTSPTNGYHSEIDSSAARTHWVQIDLGQPLSLDVVRLIPARPTDFADTPGFGFPARYQVVASAEGDLSDPQVIYDSGEQDVANPGDRPVQYSAHGIMARYVRITATRLWPRTNDYCFALAEVQIESAGRNVAVGAAVTAQSSIEAGRWSMKALVDGHTSRHALPELTPALQVALAEAQRADDEVRLRHAALEQELGIAALVVQRTAAEARLAPMLKEAFDILRHEQVYAIRSNMPLAIHVLHRGNVEQPGELIGPGALSAVTELSCEFAISPEAPEGERRAALAAWIIDGRNPLTWRSIVNRVWQYHFGRGLVETASDFGRNGERPSHPALLDWLAAEFRDGDQSFKWLHRLIVTSAAYRQAVTHDEARAALDSDNRLLWRANRRRLDAEEIRDAALAASGQLDLTMGGPGFELFGFKDDHSPVYDYAAADRPDSNRRSVYRFLVRSVPDPFFEVLDCADPSAATPRRNSTITPLQALALLNDPFMIEQSRQLAASLTAAADDVPTQIRVAVRRCYGREADDAEVELLVAYASQHGLPATCRLLFNANEFVFVD